MTTQPPITPLFDLFADVPHPTSIDAPITITPPPPEGSNEVTAFLSSDVGLREVACFSFDYREAPRPTPALTRHAVYSYQFKAKYYNFILRNKETVIYGHCWRYQPLHRDVESRSDVGRRTPRAMVVLSRKRADRFWEDVLSTLESVMKMKRGHVVERVLHELYVKYGDTRVESGKQGNVVEQIKANTLRIEGLELSLSNGKSIGASNFYHTPVPSTSMLPLLRTLSVENALRLWSALLCERRVILVSSSIERLTLCSKGAMDMLWPLVWACPYIPLLPISKLQALQYPGPYCMGVLGGDDVVEQINRMNLPSTLLVNLDYNSLTVLCPDGSSQSDIPDLLFIKVETMEERRATSIEVLARELSEILKSDKSQGASSNQISTIARDARAAEAKVREGLSKLKKFGTKLRDRMKGDSPGDFTETSPADSGHESFPVERVYHPDSDILRLNPRGELAVYRAFLSFFVCFLGNPRTYLSRDANNSIVLKTEQFLGARSQVEGPEPLGLLQMVNYFSQTQLFSQFCLEQIARYNKDERFSGKSTLFHDAVDVIAKQRQGFDVFVCRNVCADVVYNSILEFETSHLEKIRVKTSDITSNNVKLDSDYLSEMKNLVAYVKNFDFAIPCFLEVIEGRLSDCKGLQYKHALLGLQMLELSLIFGSLSILPRTHRLLYLISPLKNYTNNMPLKIKSIINDVRVVARRLQALILDWSLLDVQRAKASSNASVRVAQRDHRLRLGRGVKFQDLHSMVRPWAEAGNANVQSAPTQPHPHPVNDTFAFSSRPPSTSTPNNVQNLTDAFSSASLNNDYALGLSSHNHSSASSSVHENPFVGMQTGPPAMPTPSAGNVAATPYQTSSYHAHPTIVQVPPVPVVAQPLHNNVPDNPFTDISKPSTTNQVQTQSFSSPIPQPQQHTPQNPLPTAPWQAQVQSLQYTNVNQNANQHIQQHNVNRTPQVQDNSKQNNKLAMFDPFA